MINLFRKKTKVERLQERYTYLMKKSYDIALSDPEKSEKVHSQANKLFEEIQYLSMQHGYE